MKTIHFFRSWFRSFFSGQSSDNSQTRDELIHPRFEIKKQDVLEHNSLLFLMYSKENEALFV